ncbi:hypothetical protein [Dyella humicola]|uniref:hypothetical protein n=1 Tax=Dyella humicola TaxID=2992126 RepID=UPI0022551A74|nr:hypothetical protein [Dyella humicola]
MKSLQGVALWTAVGVCLACATARPAAATEDTGSPASMDTSTSPPMSDQAWAALFDQDIPLDERQRTLASLEHRPRLEDPQDLYMLGSLYHMGQHAHGSPVQADTEKAGLYFANAAVRGSVLAMAKMAELKLAAKDYHEAMNWAQIYAHYALASTERDTAGESYAAELIKRIDDHVERSAMDAIIKDVRSFEMAYDASIRAGMTSAVAHHDLHPTTHRHHVDVTPGTRGPDSGMADVLVAFRADGTAASVQVLDAVPLTTPDDSVVAHARSMTVSPSDGAALRYAWVPIILGDGRYYVHYRQ